MSVIAVLGLLPSFSFVMVLVSIVHIQIFRPLDFIVSLGICSVLLNVVLSEDGGILLVIESLVKNE